MNASTTHAARSMAMAVASPPPMHNEATPRESPCRSKRMKERHDEAGARRADRMAQRAGATVHVQDVTWNTEIPLRRHGDNCEGLVDLEQIHVPDAPAGLIEELADRRDRRRGEPGRILGMGCVRPDLRKNW